MTGDNSIKNLFIFTLGVGVGISISWKLMRDKYEKIANEDRLSRLSIKSKKEECDSKTEASVETNEPEEVNKDMRDYSKMASKYASTETNKPEFKEDAPYVIAPEEYGEIDEYERIELTLYADGVLVDDLDEEVIEDVDNIVGEDSLERMGEYEDDVIHVRNDRLKCDYEILRDLSNYYGDVVDKPEE